MKKQTSKQAKKASKLAKAENLKKKQAQVITVKNAEGDPDTTAEILIQNKINYTPKVSVIIPVYNVEQYLRECLDSVVNQTLKEIEIICVDDGSTDSSLEILKEYAAKDKRMTVMKQKNSFCNVARNNAINLESHGEYCGFVDPDDYINLSYYEDLYKSAKKYDADVSATWNVKIFDESGYRNKNMGINKNKACLTSFNEKKSIILAAGSTWNKIYRFDFIKSNNITFYPTKSEGGDNYFTTFSIILSNRISICSKACYYYRQTINSIVHKQKDEKSLHICDVYREIFNRLESIYIPDATKKQWFQTIMKRYYRNAKWIMEYCSKELKEKFIRQLSSFPELIISLTSYPARINTVHKTIETLLNQSIKASIVILWLAPEQFPNKEADLPQQLLNLRDKGLTIDWYHDIKSYKKLIPTLKKYPNAIIVTADDDALYEYHWIEKLYTSFLSNSTSIHCHRARKIIYKGNKILPYHQWRLLIENNKSSFYTFFTGLGGVLYPPYCLANEVINENLFMKLCPDGDDIWFWGMAVINGTPITLVKNSQNPELIDGTQETSLWATNKFKNDEQLSKILKAYPQILKNLRKEKNTLQIEQNQSKLTSYLFFPYYLISVLFLRKKKANLIATKESAKKKKQKLTKQESSLKIFKVLPIAGFRHSGGKKVWKIFGLPIFKKRITNNGKSIKYYILGINLLEVNKKTTEVFR